MNDIINAIKSRRSIRKFNYAATEKGSQSPIIIAVTNVARRQG